MSRDKDVVTACSYPHDKAGNTHVVMELHRLSGGKGGGSLGHIHAGGGHKNPVGILDTAQDHSLGLVAEIRPCERKFILLLGAGRLEDLGVRTLLEVGVPGWTTNTQESEVDSERKTRMRNKQYHYIAPIPFSLRLALHD